MDGVDFIEEIRIAQFWRKQLGEYEYIHFNPDDLRRWYVALENRGPDEIRAYLIERTGRHPIGQVTGIVSTAPHPPLNIIHLWLESYNKTRTRSVWLGGVAVLLAGYLISTNVAGCQNVPPMTALQMNPPQIGALPPLSTTPSSPATANSTLPATLPVPASMASPPAGSQTGPGGPAK